MRQAVSKGASTASRHEAKTHSSMGDVVYKLKKAARAQKRVYKSAKAKTAGGLRKYNGA